MRKIGIIFFLCGLNFFWGIKGIAPTIFVPRQLSYNPIFENTLTSSLKVFHQDRFSHFYQSEHFLLAAKPIYTQNVGSKFVQYFTIDNKPVLNVQENGTGDIDSLWFQTISQTGFYSSQLSFNPQRKTVGMMLYALLNITEHISFSVNTALINTRNTMNIFEANFSSIGQVPGLQTIKAAFSNQDLGYGVINGSQSKSGVDDIQLKLNIHKSIVNIDSQYQENKKYYEVYFLAGIPTGSGTQAKFLFEPLVGSNHAQFGLGAFVRYAFGKLNFQAEAKWRYAFAGDEIRSFDLTKNGQWSRYMLIVNALNKYAYYPAINDFTFLSKVKPQNSFDFYSAVCWDCFELLNFEIGYDFWFRQAEKISVLPVLPQPSIGIADLYNISRLNNPESASDANIWQGVIAGQNVAPSDIAFVGILPTNFNLSSAAAPLSISNSLYGSVGFTKKMINHEVRTGISIAYECGHGIHVPNNIFLAICLNVLF